MDSKSAASKQLKMEVKFMFKVKMVGWFKSGFGYNDDPKIQGECE